jgi:hypothetical protein
MMIGIALFGKLWVGQVMPRCSPGKRNHCAQHTFDYGNQAANAKAICSRVNKKRRTSRVNFFYWAAWSIEPMGKEREKVLGLP